MTVKQNEMQIINVNWNLKYISYLVKRSITSTWGLYYTSAGL